MNVPLPSLRVSLFVLGSLLGDALILPRPAVSAASEAPALYLRSAGGSERQAPQVGQALDVQVHGTVARGRLAQIFRNPSDRTVEAVYVFPLPEHAAVDHLVLRTGGRKIVGAIREIGAAKVAYERAKAEGRQASLVEQHRGNAFTTSIANLAPGAELEVEIEFQLTVALDAGVFRLTLPTVVSPRSYSRVARSRTPAGENRAAPTALSSFWDDAARSPFGVRVTLDPGFPVSGFRSPSHEIRAVDLGHGRYEVKLAGGTAPADGDFVLEWRAEPADQPRASLQIERRGDRRFVQLLVIPPAFADADDALPREVIFVVDRSGSMDGASIEQAKGAVIAALGHLRPIDSFDVIAFDDKTELLAPASLPADAAGLARGRRYAGSVEIRGGTNLAVALAAALALPEVRGALRQIVFLTDGQDDHEAVLLDLIRQKLGASRLFTVAIGAAPNRELLAKAAALGRGQTTAIANPNEIEERMAAFLGKLETPLYRDLAVTVDDPAAEVFPARLPDLYAGEPVVVSARIGPAATRLTVSGNARGVPWAEDFSLADAKPRPDGAGLDKLWARAKIEAIEQSRFDGATEAEIRAEVVRLGLEHGLVTPYTALIAVDGVAVVPAGTESERRVVPILAPPGAWSGSARYTSNADAGNPLAETITVTAESPLLDRKSISTGNTVSSAELERIPTVQDPWTILRQTPGVLVDRIGTDSSANQGSAALPANASVSLDGADVTSDPAVGVAPARFDRGGIEEIEGIAAGGDAEASGAGPAIRIVTRRGTNTFRAEAEADLGRPADETSAEPRTGRLDGARIEAGGPLRPDHAWAWANLGRTEIDRTAIGGTRDPLRIDGRAGKLNVQPTGSVSAVAQGFDSSTREEAEGAGPGRARESTLARRDNATIGRAELTWIVSSNLYLTGQLGGSHREVDERAHGDRSAPTAAFGLDGIRRGSGFGARRDLDGRSSSATGASFFTLGSSVHEIRFGAGVHRLDHTVRWAPPILTAVAGETVELSPASTLFEERRAGKADAATDAQGAWLQDLVSLGKVTLRLGLRAERQSISGGIPNGGDRGDEIRTTALVPRLGLTWSPGEEGRTILRASAGRYLERFAPSLALARPAIGLSLFDDANFHPIGPPLEAQGGDRLDPRLSPEITDELSLGIEQVFFEETTVGLGAIWRNRSGIAERRLLLRDEDGIVRAATLDDWLPAAAATGILPNGEVLSAPVWDLRPGLVATGGIELARGDRSIVSREVTLSIRRRSTSRFSGSGYLTWRDTRWHLGPRFRLFDDPTDALGGGEKDREPAAFAASAPPAPDDRFADRPLVSDPRWTLFFGGGAELPHRFGGSLAVTAREGAPITWSRWVVREAAGLVEVELGRERADRTPAVWTLDGQIDRKLTLGDVETTIALEVFNLLDRRTVLAKNGDLGTTRAGDVDDRLAGRTFKLGVKVELR